MPVVAQEDVDLPNADLEVFKIGQGPGLKGAADDQNVRRTSLVSVSEVEAAAAGPSICSVLSSTIRSGRLLRIQAEIVISRNCQLLQ